MPGGAFYLKQRQRLWERTTLFLCVSEFIRQRALEAGFPAENLRVHFIGVNPNKFSPGNEERQKHLVLFVGRLVEKKGLAYLLRAMAEIQRSATLVVIGDGPLRPRLEALATELGVPCEFLGTQSASTVQHWLRRARVLCAPSVIASSGDTEGLPIAICEAQAMGVPVVSTLHAGIPEIVVHGETGLLAPERDSQALTQYILRLLEDDAFWRQCSGRGAERMQEKFNLVTQTRELESIYAQAMADWKS